MCMPRHKSKGAQLDLLAFEPEANAIQRLAGSAEYSDAAPPVLLAIPAADSEAGVTDGRPMLVAVSLIYEDPDNPRTEFPETELDELTDDIRRHGILQPIVEITRATLSALRISHDDGAASEATTSPSNKLITQANAACDRLERALGRIRPSNSYKVALPELIALRIRVEDITKRWLQGSDRQTPSQTER